MLLVFKKLFAYSQNHKMYLFLKENLIFWMRDYNIRIKRKNLDEEMKEDINHNKKINELKTTLKSHEFKIEEYERNQHKLQAEREKLVKLYEEE